MQYIKKGVWNENWDVGMDTLYRWRSMLYLLIMSSISGGFIYLSWGVNHLLNMPGVVAFILLAMATPSLWVYFRSIIILIETATLIKLAFKRKDVYDYLEARERLRKGLKILALAIVLTALFLGLVFYIIWHFNHNLTIDYDFKFNFIGPRR